MNSDSNRASVSKPMGMGRASVWLFLLRGAILFGLAAGMMVTLDAVPPDVLSTAPKDGDQAVPVTLTNLVIEFDQDMEPRGYSVTGGGPSFPKVTGKPRWDSPQRFVLPVELSGGHDYRFGVNSPSARNFKNLAGESVAPVVIRFRTTGEATAPVGDPAKAAAELQRVIRDHYSYRDRVVTDWDARFAAALPALTVARTARTFAEEAVRLLAPAQDRHLTLKVGEELLPTTVFKLEPNADARRLETLVPGWRRANRAVASGKYSDGIGYLLIATWQGTQTDFAPAHTALDGLKEAKGLVLDMRFNAGGDETLALGITSRFAREPVVFARHRVRDPQAPGGWRPVQERVLKPDPDTARRFGGKVAVLMGGRCFSSNESFLLMMSAAGARLFGGRSAGSSANPQPFDLGNGVTMLVPSWEAQDAQGRVFEGHGLEPDQAVTFNAADAGDAVLEAALGWLRQ